MALVTCPECGREISERATACPGCGNPMTTRPAASTSVPEAASGSPSPGWYPDPSGEHASRYWDGSVWTDRTSDAPSPAPAAPQATVESQKPRSSVGAGFGGCLGVLLAILFILFVLMVIGSSVGS